MIRIENGVIIEMTIEEIAEWKAGQLSMPEPQPYSYHLFKSTFIHRLTDDEANIMEATLAAAPAKLRLMFNSVEYFVSDDPLFETLKQAISSALSPERAEELLAQDNG